MFDFTALPKDVQDKIMSYVICTHTGTLEFWCYKPKSKRGRIDPRWLKCSYCGAEVDAGRPCKYAKRA